MIGPHRLALTAVVACCLLVGAGVGAQEPVGNNTRFIPKDELVGKLVPITGDSRSLDLNILFKFGSADLTPSARRQLDALASALETSELRKASVEVKGHTDAVGSAENNRLLSERRAASVVSYIVAEHGLAVARFSSRGYGEEQLIGHLAPTSKYQRRVEIVTTFPAKEADQGSDNDAGVVVIE